MTDKEKYFWDLTGYLIVREVLSSEEIAEANEALENVDAMPVEDPQASMPDPVVPSTTQTVDPEAAAAAEAARQQTLQDEGDDAAATAAAAMDAMNEE